MYNPFNLSDKIILVTGASSGIGRAIAIECSKMGAIVVLTARNKVRLLETIREMEKPENHLIIEADLSIDGDILNLVESIPFKLDGVVQCAGLTIPKPFQFVSKDDLHKVMGVNFEAPVYLTQQLLKKKKITKFGSIVFISSISGVSISSIGGSLYSASKGAVNGIAKGLAIELASKGTRVNCVTPGMIDTNIFSEGVISQEQLDEDVRRYPLKRYGKPEEVAYAVIYLLSDASCWVTGANLLIDGGYTLL